MTALEALIRWNHPQHGRLPPDQFIQMAEHSGLVTPLTTFAIGRALSEWPCGSHQLSLAVNLSPRSLHDGSFPTRVRELLTAQNAEPGCLALEITENVIMSDPDRAVQSLERTARDGHQAGDRRLRDRLLVARHLRRLPVSQLKIDRSFIAALGQGEDEALVSSIIDLAHNLKLEVVAEGVESARRLRSAARARLRSVRKVTSSARRQRPRQLSERVTLRDRSRFEAV